MRDENPLGVARFDENVTVIGQLADPSLAVGDAVRLGGDHVLRENKTATVTGPRIEPVDGSA